MPNTLATNVTACALSVTFGDSSPKGKAKSTAGSFLVIPGALATNVTACALSVTFGDSSPKGRAKSTAGNFLIAPNALVPNFTAWLSLRGKTSPAPGEDVAQRQKGESGAGAPERATTPKQPDRPGGAVWLRGLILPASCWRGPLLRRADRRRPAGASCRRD